MGRFGLVLPQWAFCPRARKKEEERRRGTGKTEKPRLLGADRLLMGFLFL
jgi:hypothetical protein